MSKKLILPLLFAILFCISFYGVNASWCYQESANVSTACGGLNSGNYFSTGNWSNVNNLSDGNWNTYATCVTAGCALYINYTKPIDSTIASSWQTKDGVITSNITNTTTWASCWNEHIDKLELRVLYSPTNTQVIWECFTNISGGSWVGMVTSGTSNSYEEAMWWNIVNCNCTSCSDCNTKLGDSSCSEVKLTANITGAACITMNGNKTLNCQNNKITGTGNSYGFNLFNGNNTVENCKVSNYSTDIQIQSANNYILNNTMTFTSTYGLYLDGWYSNYVFNNFFNNTQNLEMFGSSGNFFNTSKQLAINIIGGNYTGGNFWANPSGTGFSQNISQCNPLGGICNNSYQIDTWNFDYLPLTFLIQDTTSPNITVRSPQNTTYNNLTILVNFSATDNVAVDKLWFNNGTANITYTTPIYVNVTEGPHTFVFYANDTNGNINSTNVSFTAYLPLSLTFVSPTPLNNTAQSQKSIYVNITSSKLLSSAILEWNGVNESMSGSGTNWYKNKLGLLNTTYSFKVYGNDSLNLWNSTPLRTVTILLANMSMNYGGLPNYTATIYHLTNLSYFNITLLQNIADNNTYIMNATNNGNFSVSFLPSSVDVSLSNTTEVRIVSDHATIGTHTFNITANRTFDGQIFTFPVSVTFIYTPTKVSGVVRDSFSNNLSNVSILVFFGGQQITSAISDSNGNYNVTVVNGTGAYLFSTTLFPFHTSNSTSVVFEGVNLSKNITLGPAPTVNLFGRIIDYSSLLGISGATVNVVYGIDNSIIASVTTNSTGYYSANVYDNYTYDVTASKVNYLINTTTVNVSGNTELNFTLIQPTIYFSEGTPQQGIAIINQDIPFSKSYSAYNPALIDKFNISAGTTLPADTVPSSIVVYNETNDPQSISVTFPSISWTIDKISAQSTRIFYVKYNTTKIIPTIATYTTTDNGLITYHRTLNLTSHNTAITNLFIYQNLSGINFTKIDLFDCTVNCTSITNASYVTIAGENISWYININGTQSFDIRAPIGQAIQVTENRVILNAPLNPYTNILWQDTIGFYNPNPYEQSVTYKVQIPINAFNIYLDGVGTTLLYPTLEQISPYVLITDVLQPYERKTKVLTYSTGPVTAEVTTKYPTSFTVGERAEVLVNVKIVNWVNDLVREVDVQIPINYGEDLKTCAGSSACPYDEPVEQAIVHGDYTFKVLNIPANAVQQYTVDYLIPTVSVTNTLNGKRAVNGVLQNYKMVSFKSSAPFTLDNVRYLDTEVPCEDVTEVLDEVNNKLYFTCPSLSVNLGTFESGGTKTIFIWYNITSDQQSTGIGVFSQIIYTFGSSVPIYGKDLSIGELLGTLAVIVGILGVTAYFVYRRRLVELWEEHTIE